MRVGRFNPYFLGASLGGAAILIAIGVKSEWSNDKCVPSPLSSCAFGDAKRVVASTKLPTALAPAAERALRKYCSILPQRAPDRFHRWRFDAHRGGYRTNPQLRLDISRLLKLDDFAKAFPHTAPLFYRSPLGWEIRQRAPGPGLERAEVEYHTDQFLAACAEVGVPLNVPVETPSGAVTIAELLNASRRNFVSGQESSWSLVAYSTYRPQELIWRNRFGDECSVNEIVDDMLAEPFDQGPCAGTHKQYAVAFLLDRIPLGGLPSGLRQKCQRYLKRSSECLIHTQLSCGAWSANWAEGAQGASPHDSFAFTIPDLVRITGHHLEWTHLAREPLRTPQPLLSAALRFLVDALDRATASTIQEEYCGYSHAACVVAWALSELPDAQDDSSLHAHVARLSTPNGSLMIQRSKVASPHPGPIKRGAPRSTDDDIARHAASGR